MSERLSIGSTSSKRRLSNGSGMLKMCDGDDSDEEVNSTSMCQEKSIYTFPKKSSSRRRSSIGGLSASKLVVNPVEQARIAEMYKTVIQMSSENKLNEKNSWNFDLIDHMGGLIKDDSRGVNFQKASCTLDASVKIYSNRVDDTYTSSHRILESLSRNGNSAAQEEEQEEEEVQGGPRKAKVGSSKSSNRLNIAQTIERNPAALNAVKLENDYAVDPMFHKISKAFDEGGAKGMLMNNLRTSATGCALSFHFKDAEEEKPSEKPYREIVDMADLAERSGITSAELASLTLCPALDEYRERMGISSDASMDNILSMFSSLPLPTKPSPINPMNTECFEDGDDCDGYFGGGDDASIAEEMDAFPSSPALSHSPMDAISPIGGGSKLQWDEDAGANLAADMELISQGLEQVALSGPAEYSYFDTNAIFSSSNAWAGARHWKYATRKRTPTTPVGDDTAVEDAVVKKSKAKRGKKGEKKADPGFMEFSRQKIDEKSFGLPNFRAKDTTLQTAAAVAKADAGAGSLLLPPDAKVQLKDLCRLHLAPSVMVPANAQQRALLSQSARLRGGSSKVDRFLCGQTGSERVWGLAAPTAVTVGTVAMSAFVPTNNADEFEDFGGDFDGDDEYMGAEDENNENAAPTTGLGFNQSGLVQADRKVEKIEIEYAKVSKRVNIQRLKKDIWSSIQTALPESETPKKEELSFQDMISGIAGGDVRQKDVTTSFYFICLLHLANEHSLEITDRPDMSDLIITMDQK